ncbi:MAG: hypothetical protein ACP5RS_07190 [Thermoplasmata archaeon]
MMKEMIEKQLKFCNAATFGAITFASKVLKDPFIIGEISGMYSKTASVLEKIGKEHTVKPEIFECGMNNYISMMKIANRVLEINIAHLTEKTEQKPQEVKINFEEKPKQVGQS